MIFFAFVLGGLAALGALRELYRWMNPRGGATL
jgi:hypothetical protein